VRFSIVIPSHNRPVRLRTCLDAISTLSYPPSEFEVIVVDDGSASPLQDAVASRAFARPFQLHFVRQKNAGPAKARNRGAEHAKGEWLVFLDDDCAPRRQWLQQFDPAVHRYPDSLLGGSTWNGCPDNVFAETNQRLLDFVIRWFEETESPLRFFPSNNMAVPARAFREVGGFDARFPVPGGEDREFCARWLASGREIRHVAEAWIDHYHPQTLATFLEMHYRYGRGAALFHRRRNTSPLLVRSNKFNRDLIRMFASGQESLRRRALQLGIVTLSQAAAAAGFARQRLAGGAGA
jgi:glycosyltransferase involved in cell wall biosynthesis